MAYYEISSPDHDTATPSPQDVAYPPCYTREHLLLALKSLIPTTLYRLSCDDDEVLSTIQLTPP